MEQVVKIRRAEAKDAARINELLYQVAEIHANGRGDIFKEATKKYSDEDLRAIIENDTTPIFVAVNEEELVLGYAFCIHKVTENHILFQDKRTLYIDDICVDEKVRGSHVGKQIYEYAEAYAKENGFDNITLNVWAFNEGAYKFYESCGMVPQRTIMEKIL